MDKLRQKGRQLLAMRLSQTMFTLTASFGGAVLGIGLYALIVFLTKGEEHEYISLCTLMGGMIGIVIAMVYSADTTYPRAALHLGCTRRQLLLGELLANAADVLLVLALLAVVSVAEEAIVYAVFPDAETSGFTGAIARQGIARYGIWIVLLFASVLTFLRVMVLKYGNRGRVVVWLLFMAATILLPRIAEAAEEAPNSVFGRLGIWAGEIIGRLPAWGGAAVGAAAVVALTLGSYGFVRKLQA